MPVITKTPCWLEEPSSLHCPLPSCTYLCYWRALQEHLTSEATLCHCELLPSSTHRSDFSWLQRPNLLGCHPQPVLPRPRFFDFFTSTSIQASWDPTGTPKRHSELEQIIWKHTWLSALLGDKRASWSSIASLRSKLTVFEVAGNPGAGTLTSSHPMGRPGPYMQTIASVNYSLPATNSTKQGKRFPLGFSGLMQPAKCKGLLIV